MSEYKNATMERIKASKKLVSDKFSDVPPQLLPNDDRPMKQSSYTAAWIGGSIYIGVFMVGSSLVPPNGPLNLIQAFIALLIGLSIIAVCYNLNGTGGNKFGIPFVVQTRSCFGISGSKFPVLIRAVPALFWYGVQSWVGATAINAISARLIGYDNIVLYFVLFQALQIILSMTGFEGMKIVESLGSIVIVVALVYMFYTIVTVFGSEIGEKLINIPGTWGMQFWSSVVVIIGVMTAMMLNINDYTREYAVSSQGKMFIAHWIGSVPIVIFMAMIGLFAAGVTGAWDPIQLFTELLPNSAVLIIALIFVAAAQVTTNIMLNVVPPTFILMEFFGWSYKKGALITGLIVPLTFPWKIMTVSGFFTFIQFYSMFLGPIFAVMVVDYWLVRKQEYNVLALYDKKGLYAGINWAGIISIIIGAVIGYVVSFELAWAISLIPSGIIYYVLLMKTNIAVRFKPEAVESAEIVSVSLD